MRAISKQRLAELDVDVAGDNAWQAQLRLSQALWREREGLPAAPWRDGVLGSRLAMPHAREQLSNFLTPTIKEIVTREVLGAQRDRSKLYGAPRIFDNLLSSQPLCFNLFGELSVDLTLATDALRPLWPDRIEQVTAIEFEHSPGRDDPNYLGNKSAFDVYIEHSTSNGGRGFIGIEVKYHENLKVEEATHKDRYVEVATESQSFADPLAVELRQSPLQQIW